MNRIAQAVTRHRWVTLGSALALVAVGLSVPAGAGRPSAAPGCQPDRRTTVHGSGQQSGKGNWEPCLVSTGMPTNHSGLGIDRTGALLRSVVPSPGGIAVSTDKGRTWARRALPAGAAEGASDSYLDPVTNRFYYWGLVTGQPGPVHYTDDRGKTWHQGTFDSPLRFDWPRMFSGRPVNARAKGWKTNVYFCDWSNPGDSQVGCYVSRDGGATFVTAAIVLHEEPCLKPQYLAGLTFGRGIVDPRTGYIHQAAKQCGQFWMYVSRDEAKTWTAHVIPGSRSTPLTAPATQNDQPWLDQNAGFRFNPVSAALVSSEIVDSVVMDATGRKYVGWIDGETFLPYLATSVDEGRTWSAPVKLSPPEVTRVAMLSMAMTRAGRLGLSYYGTTNLATYTGYMSVSDNPAVLAPTFQTATVTRPGQPLMNEPCCWASGAQEYSSARWAPDGSLWAAFATSKPSEDPGLGVVGRLVPTSAARR